MVKLPRKVLYISARTIYCYQNKWAEILKAPHEHVMKIVEKEAVTKEKTAEEVKVVSTPEVKEEINDESKMVKDETGDIKDIQKTEDETGVEPQDTDDKAEKKEIVEAEKPTEPKVDELKAEHVEEIEETSSDEQEVM